LGIEVIVGILRALDAGVISIRRYLELVTGKAIDPETREYGDDFLAPLVKVWDNANEGD